MSSFALAVRYGEACDCSAKSPCGAQHCCDSGLVCSRSSKTCKPALGKQCTPSWIPGYTDCAKGTYNADIKCKPYKHMPEKGWCCLKSGSWVPHPLIARAFAAMVTSHGRTPRCTAAPHLSERQERPWPCLCWKGRWCQQFQTHDLGLNKINRPAEA